MLCLTSKGAQSALSAASSRGHYEVAELLLDSGASVNAVDNVSTMALDVTVYTVHHALCILGEVDSSTCSCF